MSKGSSASSGRADGRCAARLVVASYVAPMARLLKFLALVVLLNVIRYLAGYPFESAIIFHRLFGEMEKSPAVFNSNFTTFDWVTSYF